MIRLGKPSIENDDLEAVTATLETGYLVQGLKVQEFETAIAKSVGTKHAVAVSNGTAALHLALLALDIKAGDIVVTTSYSWLSTANVIELCGAQPVFTDINEQSFNMCTKSLDSTLARLMSNRETAKRVKAILPVHAFGLMADMPEILALAENYGIAVIEDAACALGASLKSQKAGSWGIMGTFSFHPRKAITTGEGGMVTTNNDELAWRLKVLRNHGLDPNASTPRFIMPGFNYRMTEFQAALGLSQFAKLERILDFRGKAVSVYNTLLEGTSFQSPFCPQDTLHVYQSFVGLIPKEVAGQQKELIKELKQKGIEANIGTWHMPLTDYYQARYGYQKGDFPHTDLVFDRALTLPLFEGINQSEQNRIVDSLSQVLDR